MLARKEICETNLQNLQHLTPLRCSSKKGLISTAACFAWTRRRWAKVSRCNGVVLWGPERGDLWCCWVGEGVSGDAEGGGADSLPFESVNGICECAPKLGQLPAPLSILRRTNGFDGLWGAQYVISVVLVIVTSSMLAPPCPCFTGCGSCFEVPFWVRGTWDPTLLDSCVNGKSKT